jgi:hypothetical protein
LTSRELIETTSKKTKYAQHNVINPRRISGTTFFGNHTQAFKLYLRFYPGRINFGGSGMTNKAFINGKIYTVNENQPIADTVITVGNKILFVGKEEEAIKCYTLNSAYAAFEENVKGSIEPGKLADFVVLSEDILTINPAEIINVEVDRTIFDGEVIYQRES